MLAGKRHRGTEQHHSFLGPLGPGPGTRSKHTLVLFLCAPQPTLTTSSYNTQQNTARVYSLRGLACGFLACPLYALLLLLLRPPSCLPPASSHSPPAPKAAARRWPLASFTAGLHGIHHVLRLLLLQGQRRCWWCRRKGRHNRSRRVCGNHGSCRRFFLLLVGRHHLHLHVSQPRSGRGRLGHDQTFDSSTDRHGAQGTNGANRHPGRLPRLHRRAFLCRHGQPQGGG